MIIIFKGKGKGKTSAAIGTALRALYHNRKVIIIQFLKTGSSGEMKLLNKYLSKNLTIHSFGKKAFTNEGSLNKKDYSTVKKAILETSRAIDNKPFMIILDELLVALKFKLVEEGDILNIMKQCRKINVHLIITGRGASKSITNKADLVTEMKNIKHPYEKGIKAVKGIDF